MLWHGCIAHSSSFLVRSQWLKLFNDTVSGWKQHRASYQIGKIADCACAGNAGNVFPATKFKRKSLVSDPGMYHGTCVTHVPWCMTGSITHAGGKIVPGIPGACAKPNFTNLVREPWHTLYQRSNDGSASMMRNRQIIANAKYATDRTHWAHHPQNYNPTKFIWELVKYSETPTRFLP